MFAIALTGCSKKSDTQPIAVTSSFTIDGAKYPASIIDFMYNTLMATAKSNSQVTISLLFKSKPVAGSYPVVGNELVKPGCSMEATGTDGNSYSSINNNSGSVTIAISNGKLHATFSGIKLVNDIDQSYSTFSGDLTEQ